MFIIFIVIKSARQKTRTAIIILEIFFFATKTDAKAIQPLPPAIFGTNEEILIVKKLPEIQVKNPAKHHDKVTREFTETPTEDRTSLSDWQNRKRNPIFVLKRNKIDNKIKMIPKINSYIFTLKILNEKSDEIKTPLVPKTKKDKHETKLEKSKFNEKAEINDFALNF